MADTYDAELFYRDGRAMARYPDGEEVLLADVMRYMNPGTEFDDATGSQMAATPPRADAPGFAVSPPEEDRFGATAAYMAEPYFADAGAIMSEAGQRPTYFTDPVLGSVERAGQYLGDAGMAGLNALGGAVYGGAGLLGDIFGGTPQQERRLARDIAGGTDVAGVGPELRIVDALRRGGPSLLDFATDAGKAAAPAVRQFNPTIPSSNMAVIRQDDIFRGHGVPKVSYDTATKPYAVRLTGLDQVEDMIASGLVRPKPGGYGKQGSSTLYFGEADTLDPTVFTKLSDSKGARLVADSAKIAGREGPISLNDLLHVFVLKDGKEVDILQDILRRNQRFGGTAVPPPAQAMGQQPQGLLESGPQ